MFDDHDQPSISVLIANFNNGPESSLFGVNLIAECLEAVVMTIGEDVCWEIIIHDDGSTDSGIETVRSFVEADRRIRLIEGKHVGRVGAIFNDLTEKARGSICVRMDGDTVTLTPTWGERIIKLFNENEKIGMVGPVQIWDPRDNDAQRAGKVRCFRCWLWTPKGRRNPWRGCTANVGEEASGSCDYVSGSWVAFRKSMWEESVRWCSDYQGRGEDLDWFVMAKKSGYLCYGDAGIQIVHRDTVRVKRGYRDTKTEQADCDLFKERWGFHHYYPDAVAVAEWGDDWRKNERDVPEGARW